MRNIFIITLMSLVVLLALTGCNSNASSEDITRNIVSDTNDNPEKTTIYFFWGDGCPHCAAEKPVLEALEKKYGDQIEVKMFETWKNPENARLFTEVAKAYGTTAQGVPTTFIGEKYWVGYADYMGKEMEAKIKSCIDTGCVNPGDKLN